MAKTERCCKDVEVFKKELQEIATELGLLIEDGEVLCEWCRRGNSYNLQIWIEVVQPTYFAPFGQVLKVLPNGIVASLAPEDEGVLLSEYLKTHDMSGLT